MFGDLPEPLRYTEKEAAMLARLAEVRVVADAGDRKAKRKMAQLRKQLATLHKRAKKGNAVAARAVLVIEESGLLEPSQTFEMDGADTRTPEQLHADAFAMRKQAARLDLQGQTAAAQDYIKQAEALEARAWEIQKAKPMIVPYTPSRWNPWTWQLLGFNVTNVALLATSGVLAWRGKWGWAAVPAGIVALHEAQQKSWF